MGRLQAEHGFRPANPAGTSLADFAGQVSLRADLMALEREATPSLDRKGQGAHLVSSLSYRVGAALALADLTDQDFSRLDPSDVQISAHLVHGSKGRRRSGGVRYEVATPFLPPGRGTAERTSLGAEALFRGLVEAVAADVRLSQGALWRLVSDGIAAAYLGTGRELGRVNEAMDRTWAILRRKGSPLQNRQMRFLKVVIPADQSPSGAAIADWFRIRGGCCRFYTTDGGDFCGTCVLRDDHEQRLRAHLLSRAQADAQSFS